MPVRILACAALIVCLPIALARGDESPLPAAAANAVEYAPVLAALELTPDQQARVRQIEDDSRARADALTAAEQATRAALLATPPTEPGYAILLADAQSQAASRLQLSSDAWSQIYAVLTPSQRARVPALVSRIEAARDGRRGSFADTTPAG